MTERGKVPLVCCYCSLPLVALLSLDLRDWSVLGAVGGVGGVGVGVQSPLLALVLGSLSPSLVLLLHGLGSAVFCALSPLQQLPVVSLHAKRKTRERGQKYPRPSQGPTDEALHARKTPLLHWTILYLKKTRAKRGPSGNGVRGLNYSWPVAKIGLRGN